VALPALECTQLRSRKISDDGLQLSLLMLDESLDLLQRVVITFLQSSRDAVSDEPAMFEPDGN